MENLKSIDKRFGQPVRTFTTFNQTADKLYLNPKVSPVNALSSPVIYQHSSLQKDRRPKNYMAASTERADTGYHQHHLCDDNVDNCTKRDFNNASKNKQIRLGNHSSNKSMQQGKQFDANGKGPIPSGLNESKATKFSYKMSRDDSESTYNDALKGTARCDTDGIEHSYGYGNHKPYTVASSKATTAVRNDTENRKALRAKQHQRVHIQSHNITYANDAKSENSKNEQIANLSKSLDVGTRVRCGNLDESSYREGNHNHNLQSKKSDSGVSQANSRKTHSICDKKNSKGAPGMSHPKVSSTNNKTSMSAILKEKCELLMSKNNLLPRSNSMDGAKEPIVHTDCKKPSQSVEFLHQVSRSEFPITFRKESKEQNSNKYPSSESLKTAELRPSITRKLNDTNTSTTTTKRMVKFASDRYSTSHVQLKKSQSVDSQLDYNDSSHYCYESSRPCKDENFYESKDQPNPRRVPPNYNGKVSSSNKMKNRYEAGPAAHNSQSDNDNYISESDFDHSSNGFKSSKFLGSNTSDCFEGLRFENQSTPWYQEIAELSYCLPSNKKSNADVNESSYNHNRKVNKKPVIGNTESKHSIIPSASGNQSQNSDDYHDNSSVCTKDLGHDSGIDSSASYPQKFILHYHDTENSVSHICDGPREDTGKGKSYYTDYEGPSHTQVTATFAVDKSRNWVGKDCTEVSHSNSRHKSTNSPQDDTSSTDSTLATSDKILSCNNNQNFYPIKNRENSFDSLTHYSKTSASTSGSKSSRKRISYLFEDKVERKSVTGSNSGGSSSTEGRGISSSIKRDRRRSSRNQLTYIAVDEKSKKVANRSNVRSTALECATSKSKRKGKGKLSSTCKVS
ncbi:hypothetical protein TrispH2_001155 [Trichoplax sp. H2]|uniref:Uncharacterized protein n=1 Tax=Trichoplax adhaerens TaxID=10228 RepID=B3RXZ1_TRIAD|nr:hypothetical protein TRIADDRAFT_56380 [Trichoplax adhaerens]EDV24511.1 hypothetical protein TRIADDRAFT_56380 [Trichoplax adhaerens]RDD46870.1 hypothetical protein TrispH2_001155 [Trichoplax sp. H2]|eukprot:XP_002112401.1 hypothetical protein TRIADDRAFT_56380 [Trichoplax adhaerens]